LTNQQYRYPYKQPRWQSDNG